MKLYLAIIGHTATGKESSYIAAKEEFAGKFTVSIHHFSDPLNENLDLLCLPRTRLNQQAISTALRGTFGEELLGNIIYERASDDPSDIVFLDGVRRPQDVVMLKRLSQTHAFLVYICAPIEERFKRLTKRNDRPGDAEKTWEQFLAEQSAETESLIDALRPMANFELYNSFHDPEFRSLRFQVVNIISEKLRRSGRSPDSKASGLNLSRTEGTDVA